MVAAEVRKTLEQVARAEAAVSLVAVAEPVGRNKHWRSKRSRSQRRGANMGLVTANTVGLSGLVAPKPTVQIITSSTDNVVIPAGSTRVYIEVIGGGGGGASSSPNGGGGGGGAFARAIFDADALEPTLDVVVGAVTDYSGHGSAGRPTSGASNGSAGNYSEVHLSSAGTVILKAYGGGGGSFGSGANTGGSGGGGGGTGLVGSNASGVNGR